MANNSSPSGDESREVWGKAIPKEPERPHPDDVDKPTKPRKGRWKRIVLLTLVVLVVGVGILVALAPTIAGAVAPGIVRSQSDKAMPGYVTVDDVSLSWGGPQELTGVKVFDAEGKEVARMRITTTAGLFALAGLNLGEVTVAGVRADIVRREDGQTNIQAAVVKPSTEPAPPPSTEPLRLPAGLKANLTIENVEITYTDAAAKDGPVSVKVSDVAADATLEPGRPLTFDLRAQAGLVGAPGTGRGSIAITAKANNWSDAGGLVTPEKAIVDATVTAESVPSALVDAFIGPITASGGTVSSALGPAVNVAAKVDGSMTEATARVDVTAANATAALRLAVKDGVVQVTEPGRVSVKPQAVRVLADLDAALAGQDAATITSAPGLELTIDRLRLPFDPKSPGLNLRGAAVGATIATTQIEGTTKLRPDAAAEPFTVAPLNARIASDDLGADTTLKATTQMTLSGRPAGDVNIDFTVSGLLDDKGAPRPMPAGARGVAAIRGVATAVAQPFVESMGLNLPRDVGPTVDVEVRATAADLSSAGAPAATASAASALPAADIDLAVAAEHVTVNGAFRLDQGKLTTRGNGLTANIAKAASIASAFAKPETGYRVSAVGNQGSATLALSNLEVSIDDPDPRRMRAQSVLTLGGMRITKLNEDGSAAGDIDVQNFRATTSLGTDGAPKVQLAGSMQHGGKAFGLEGDLTLTGLFGAGEELINTQTLRPVGTITLRDVPTALAGLFVAPATPAEGEPAPLDMPAVIADAVGPAVTVALRTATSGADGLAINADITAARLTAAAGATLGADRLNITKVNAESRLEPATANALIARFMPAEEGSTPPRLAAPSKVTVALAPFAIPMEGFAPQLERGGIINATIAMPGRTLVEGLTLANEDGTKRDLGRVGVENLELRVRAAMPALLTDALPSERTATVNLKAGVVGGEGTIAELAQLEGRIAAEVSEGTIAGPSVANIDIKQIDTRQIDRVLNDPGMVSGALGDRAQLGLVATLRPVKDAPLSEAGADLSVTAAAPNLRMSNPIRFVAQQDRITMGEPATIEFTASADWANRFLTPPKPQNAGAGGAGTGASALAQLRDQASPQPPAAERPPMTLTAPTTVRLTLSKLALSRPPMEVAAAPAAGAAPANAAQTPSTPQAAPPPPLFKPGIFDVNLAVDVPALNATAADGRTINLQNTRVTVERVPQTPTVDIGYALTIGQAAVGEAAPTRDMRLSGSVTNLAGADGRLAIPTARLSADGRLPAIPTALVDALANQDGLLVDALGPIVEAQIKAARVPLGGFASVPAGPSREEPPVIDLIARSPRAAVKLKGNINGPLYVSQEPLEVSVWELTRALSDRFLDGLPAIGAIEKTQQDAPATIRATGMTVPLDGQLQLLNADVVIDPGEARFSTSDTFGKLLKKVAARQSGVVGQRLQPLNVEVRQGIIRYPRYRIPLGEFSIETEGTVNLPAKTLDVVTWVPFGSLTDEAAGSFNTGLGSLLGRSVPLIESATMVPIRTKGPLDKPSTAPDLELFARNVIETVRPDNLLRDALEKIRGGGK